MKVYAFQDPSIFPEVDLTSLFRHVIVTGTWIEEPCVAPGECHSVLGAPLLVETGSDGKELGQIVFAAGSHLFICSSSVAKFFDSIGGYFNYEMVLAKFPKSRSGIKAKWERMSFVWPRPKKTISIDAEKNGLVRQVECERCQRWCYKYKHDGLLLERASIKEIDVFTIAEIGPHAPIFVTEAFVDEIERHVVENLGFRLVGRTE